MKENRKLMRVSVRATPHLRTRIDALAREAGVTRAEWLRTALVGAEKQTSSRTRQPAQSDIAWALLEVKDADATSISLSTRIPCATLETIKRLAHEGHVTPGAWIGYAAAEACGPGAHRAQIKPQTE